MMRAAIVLVAIAACSHPKPLATGVDAACDDAIDGVLTGEPARLRGLPSGCALPDAFERLGFPAELGEPGTGYDVHRRLRGTGEARAYLEKGTLVLVELIEPPHPASNYALDEPDVRLDFTWRDVVRPDAEAVWLTRGIAIATDGNRVLRIASFPPTTLEHYKQALRYFDTSRDVER